MKTRRTKHLLVLVALVVLAAGCGGSSSSGSAGSDAGSGGGEGGGSVADAAAPIDGAAQRADAGAAAEDASVGRDAGLAPVDGGAGAADSGGGAADAGIGAPDAGRPDASAPFAPGTGFDATYTRWAVPPSGLADGFFSSSYTLGARGWIVVDLDGDGVQDLVQTADAQNGSGYVWSDLQGPYWRLFKGARAGGFAQTPTRWSVPASGLPDGFFGAYYGYDTRHWSLLDLDGDGRPELVQTADSARSGGQVWTDSRGAYWKVWRSSAAGFSGAFERFAVPASGLADGFFGASYCLDARCWSLADLDADGRLDLVQSADPTKSGGIVFSDAGGPFWKVWSGGASGFAATSQRFTVPASGLADGFFATSYTSAAPGTRFWSLFDVDGDRRLDLVHTANPATAGGVVWGDAQGPFWKAYLGGAAGISSTSSRVSVPASGLSDGFFASTSFAAPQLGGQRNWMTIDLDGDRKPELVQTSDPTRTGGYVFTDAQGAYWKVWRITTGAAPTGPARWSVPASGLADGFFAPFWTDGPSGSRAWFMRDLDGDGRLDLVQTADTARTGLYVWSDAQGAYWKVYRGR
jgi:hypothetical protein